jgi:hypothetical protein
MITLILSVHTISKYTWTVFTNLYCAFSKDFDLDLFFKFEVKLSRIAVLSQA